MQKGRSGSTARTGLSMEITRKREFYDTYRVSINIGVVMLSRHLLSLDRTMNTHDCLYILSKLSEFKVKKVTISFVSRLVLVTAFEPRIFVRCQR